MTGDVMMNAEIQSEMVLEGKGPVGSDAAISEFLPEGCPYIRCANFQTAWYYKTQAHKGLISADDWESGKPAISAPYYLVLLN